MTATPQPQQDAFDSGRREALLAGTACLLGATAASAGIGPGQSAPWTGGRNDFDFIAGEWIASNRRLMKRGVGSQDWDTFPATVSAHLHLGGLANTDEIDFPTKGWSGMTLRHFDLTTRQWSIYWINSREGKMLPPVVGGFRGDVGEFLGDDDDEGRPVKVKFTWRKLSPDAAHWEQAFSYNGGPWETNWIIELKRRQK
jgi:hypothetical protein